jgi:hypothetical protein
MRTQPQHGASINVVIAAIFVALSLAVLVLVALGLGMLWSLIGGVFAVGLILIGLSWIGVNLFSRYTEASIKAHTLKYDHIEHMAKLGYTITGAGYEPLQLPEPPADMPVSLQGITAEQLASFKIHAVNLLALSKQEMGETSGQVIPFYRARENDYFKDVAVWTNGVRYLIANQMAGERYKGNKKIGTFLNAGTVGQAYDLLRGA